jgi:hypothetical protein
VAVAFTITPLGPQHDRAAFSCGNAVLDDYLRTKARKEAELGYCAVFILAEEGAPATIAGYYMLSSYSIALDGIAQQVRKRLPRYPLVPAMLIGRLARDVRFRNAHVGATLLLDAMRRTLHISAQIGAYAVMVDAIDDSAAAFYERHGFIPLSGGGNRLYLPIESIRKLQL